jgi:serine kinase of HPr protein (carbohydrate metabolism regulator)
MEAEGADIVLLDLRLGEENGLEVLERIKRIDPNTEVIMMTAFGSIDTSVNAMQKGAFTYLTKPINIEELKVIMQQASNIRKLNEHIYYLSDQLESKSRFDAIIGESAPMQRVYMLIDRVKDIDTNVLITGESGIGKSEAALELIRRGHRLVTDDVVELRKVSDDTLVGSAPDITKHFIELRGIGIVDVKALFGALSVKDTQTIDLVIRLEDWDKDKEYDRLGLEENYTEYLGNKVVCHNIPIRPGRNLAVICETAAINHRQKKMGYNAAKELYTRVQNSLAKRREEDEDDE